MRADASETALVVQLLVVVPLAQGSGSLTFRELGELGYKFIFITLYGAHASMFAVWNAMHDLVKNEEQGQWALERTKVGHPTEAIT